MMHLLNRKQVFLLVSPNLSLPILVLIKLPSPLFFPAGETFIFQRQKHCLFNLNLIFSLTKQFTVLSVILNP